MTSPIRRLPALRKALPGILLLCSLAAAAPAAENNANAERDLFRSIKWTEGPAEVNLGTAGKLTLPPGYRFTDAAGAAAWSTLTHNPAGSEIGVLTPPLKVLTDPKKSWFMLFNYDDIGYVKDDETLNDATIDKIFEQIKAGTEKSNEMRRSRGWEPINVDGWARRPFYEPMGHHLTWAISARDEGNQGVVNYQSRVLGRRGVMRVTMVLSPDQLDSTTPTYNNIVAGIHFNPGDTYQEFRSGDKVAEYGLIGLISGGAAVAAVKLWKPLMKLGAFIVVGISAAFRKIKRMFTGKPA